MKSLIFALLVTYALASLPGGWVDVDVDDESVKDVIQFAAKHVNQQFKTRYHSKLLETRRVRSQVVAGVQYEVKITLQETTCKKAESTFEEANECDLREGSFPKYCAVTVWEKSWQDFRKVTHFSCHSTPY